MPSGKVIAVKTYFNDQLMKELNSNPIFKPKQKGESKVDYAARKQEAAAEKLKIINILFPKYEEQIEFKNTP